MSFSPPQVKKYMTRSVFLINNTQQSIYRTRVDRILSNIIRCNHNSICSFFQHSWPKWYMHKHIFQHLGNFSMPIFTSLMINRHVNGIEKCVKWTKANDQCRSRHGSMFIPANVMKSMVFAHIARGKAMAHTCLLSSCRKSCTIPTEHCQGHLLLVNEII